MIRKWFKLKTSDIQLVQFILEGYEGLVTVSTIDPKDAIIQILIIPEFLEDVEGILDYLKDRRKDLIHIPRGILTLKGVILSILLLIYIKSSIGTYPIMRRHTAPI